MVSPTEFSVDPNANTTIGGVNVAEMCPPDGINNALRYVAAVVRVAYNSIPGPGAYVPASGGTFTGDIVRQGRGGYLHHASSALTSGQVYFLPEGSALPAAAEGSIVFFYT